MISLFTRSRNTTNPVADVHRRALAHGVETFQHLDGAGVIGLEWLQIGFRHVPCPPAGIAAGLLVDL